MKFFLMILLGAEKYSLFVGKIKFGMKIMNNLRKGSGNKNKEAMWNCEYPICHSLWQVRGSHLN